MARFAKFMIGNVLAGLMALSGAAAFGQQQTASNNPPAAPPHRRIVRRTAHRAPASQSAMTTGTSKPTGTIQVASSNGSDAAQCHRYQVLMSDNTFPDEANNWRSLYYKAGCNLNH